MSQISIDRTTDDDSAPSRRRLPIVLGVGLIVVGAAAAGLYVLAGTAEAKPETALRAAAMDFNNAMLAKAPAKNLLKYEKTSCTAQERKDLTAAPGVVKLYAPGVTGFRITKVTVTGAKGLTYIEPTGPGAAAIKNIADTGNPLNTADAWVLTGGKWFRAAC